jgi:tetratricopeptide (TPR) repeat protein
MLALAADVETRAGRYPQAASRLEAWRREDPSAPLPRLLLARLAAQVDGDLPRAAALLDEAAPLATGDFLAARLEAHRAAVALARGDEPAARRAVAAGLARVPASAPARYQAARLAFLGGDRAALRESAGVVGQRCGRPAALLLAARQAELGSDTLEEAAQAWRAWAEATPRDPAAALAAAGAVARIGLSGPALRLAAAGVSGDPLEARLRAEVTDCWEGPAGLAEAARRLESIGTTEPAAAGRAFTAAAACALLTGQTVQAERLARRAAAAAPMAGAPRLLLAQVALDRGRPAEALRLAAAAADLPGGEAAGSLTARALEASGRLELAARAAGAAAGEQGSGAAARLGLARLLARLGRRDEALAAARSLLAEDPAVVGARGLLLELAGPPPGGRK